MDTKQILNQFLYPSVATNVRRKSYPLYDTQAIAAGVTEYFYYVTAPGNIFLRNTQLPLAGTNVFFATALSAYLELNISTLALANSLNELLQQSFLEISIDNRVVCKLPGLDFINYMVTEALSDQVVVTALQPSLCGNLNSDGFLGRKLPLPIVINSTSSFTFRFVTTAAAATAFDGINLRLTLHGIQLDKLESFTWDNLKDAMFQKVPVTYYQTVVIPNGNAQTFSLFTNPAEDQRLHSKTFPLSDITTMSIQNIEIFVNQPDTPIEPTTAWNSRLTDNFKINVDEVEYYNSNLQNILSMFSGFGVILTSTPNLDVVNFFNKRQSRILPIPVELPPNSNIVMSLTQPVTSLGVTGEFTVALRGVETRRVA